MARELEEEKREEPGTPRQNCNDGPNILRPQYCSPRFRKQLASRRFELAFCPIFRFFSHYFPPIWENILASVHAPLSTWIRTQGPVCATNVAFLAVRHLGGHRL